MLKAILGGFVSLIGILFVGLSVNDAIRGRTVSEYAFFLYTGAVGVGYGWLIAFIL